MPRFARAILSVLWLCVAATPASAERLCDTAHENCRAALLALIQAEQAAIDVAFWFMEDARYSNALVQKAREGVPVRVLVDPRANPSHPVNAQILNQLASAGIPMRQRASGGILHWKMMLFAGQRVVQFSGANYSAFAFSPSVPYSNYIDEVVYFSDDLGVVQSFMHRYDDLWTNTVAYRNYANVSGTPARRYSRFQLDPDLNFPPAQSFRQRSVSGIAAETIGIDAVIYRITDRAYTDALIGAAARGVSVRLITEPEQYRDPSRLWHAWNVDRLHRAGIQIRHRAHAGLMHQKSVVLHAQQRAMFGSSNWTSPSSDSQDEHNYFTSKGWIVAWLDTQFARKWNNLGPAVETQPFQPLPPDPANPVSPRNGAVNVPRETSLVFSAGPFAHLYDIYFGTTPNPPLIETNLELGPTPPGGSPRRYRLQGLSPNTTYYWRIVAKTMALRARDQAVWAFTTGSQLTSPPPSGPPPPAPPPAPGPAGPGPSPGTGSCPTAQPASDWICVNGGWVPPGHPLAQGTSPPPAPVPPPDSRTCVTVSPAPGWVCVAGGWVPPDHPLAQHAGPSGGGGTPSGAPAPPSGSGACATVRPASNWVCINGGWVPPDHPLARGG